jgi:hypothetical protein
MNREQAMVSSDQHPGLPFVPLFGPQLNANADIEKVRPRFSRQI